MNVNELLSKEQYKDIENVEIYRDQFQHRLGFHTERIKSVEDVTGEEEVIEYQIMDEDDYNSTILANCGMKFKDFYNSTDKVLVIKIK